MKNIEKKLIMFCN